MDSSLHFFLSNTISHLTTVSPTLCLSFYTSIQQCYSFSLFFYIYAMKFFYDLFYQQVTFMHLPTCKIYRYSTNLFTDLSRVRHLIFRQFSKEAGRLVWDRQSFYSYLFSLCGCFADFIFAGHHLPRKSSCFPIVIAGQASRHSIKMLLCCS